MFIAPLYRIESTECAVIKTTFKWSPKSGLAPKIIEYYHLRILLLSLRLERLKLDGRIGSVSYSVSKIVFLLKHFNQ